MTEGPQPPADWTPLVGAWLGFGAPPTPVAQTNCAGFPEPWPDDIAGHIASMGWGVAVAPLDPLMEDDFRSAVGPDFDTDWAPFLLSGGPRGEAIEMMTGEPEGFMLLNYALIYEADADMNMVDPVNGSFVPVEGLDGTEMPLGVYTTSAFYLMAGAELLGEL